MDSDGTETLDDQNLRASNLRSLAHYYADSCLENQAEDIWLKIIQSLFKKTLEHTRALPWRGWTGFTNNGPVSSPQDVEAFDGLRPGEGFRLYPKSE